MTKIRHSLWAAGCCMLVAGAISVGVAASTAGTGDGAGVGAGFRAGVGEGANNQFNKLVVGDEILSRLVLGPPKA